MAAPRVAVFMSEGIIADATPEQVAGIHGVLQASARRAVAKGRPVRYLRGVYLPGEKQLICLFEAADAGLVRRVYDNAQLPFVRITTALEFPVNQGSDVEARP
ncbi:MAG: DUF4242 domain-containing protein [Actinomycetota bacterium]|nr:DUF4242 domain-containing protein [Actinomycetota bacterium]